LKQPLLRLIASDCSNNNRNISADTCASVTSPEGSRQPAQLPQCARDGRRRGLINFGTRLMAAGFSSRSLGFSPRVFFIYTTTHCSLLRFIVRSGLEVPTFATRCLHACHHARAPSGGRRNCGREMSGKFCLNGDFHVTFRNLLHGTDGFTSPPKGRIFFDLKIRRLPPDLNPRTWVPKAITQPLGHRSR
jgi:hypothetical protein